MKWENVLKVQITGSKQKVKMGNIPIPTEEEGNCKDKIREFYEKAKTIEENWTDAGYLNQDYLSEMSEKVVCEILQFIQNYTITTKFHHSKRDGNMQRVARRFTPKNEGNSIYYALVGTIITESYVQLFCLIKNAQESFPIVNISTKKFHDYHTLQNIPNDTDFKELFDKIDWRK